MAFCGSAKMSRLILEAQIAQPHEPRNWAEILTLAPLPTTLPICICMVSYMRGYAQTHKRPLIRTISATALAALPELQSLGETPAPSWRLINCILILSWLRKCFRPKLNCLYRFLRASSFSYFSCDCKSLFTYYTFSKKPHQQRPSKLLFQICRCPFCTS